MEEYGHPSTSTPQFGTIIGNQLVTLINSKHPLVVIINHLLRHKKWLGNSYPIRLNFTAQNTLHNRYDQFSTDFHTNQCYKKNYRAHYYRHHTIIPGTLSSLLFNGHIKKIPPLKFYQQVTTTREGSLYNRSILSVKKSAPLASHLPCVFYCTTHISNAGA